MSIEQVESVLDELGHYLLGKRRQLEYALTCLLARGHLPIEDVPGVGKTTLAKSMAHSFEAQFNRVQCTSDLLPSDLIGVTVFRQSKEAFEFQPGPIFTNVLLADEINRANPKTQSALLEAMHDGQISHDGTTMPLPKPFFVIATQNSKDQHGTFPLPESQLDRFLVKIKLGYPNEEFEKQVIKGEYRSDHSQFKSLSKADLMKLQDEVTQIYVADELLDYMYRLVDQSRNYPGIKVGVSPRGGQYLYRSCQALAYVRGRDFVSPDDVREMTPLVCCHRIIVKQAGLHDGGGMDISEKLFREILETVAAPE